MGGKKQNITQRQNVIQTIKRTVNSNVSRFHIKTVKMYPSNSANLFTKRFHKESVGGSLRRFVMEDQGLDIVEEATADSTRALVELEVLEILRLMLGFYQKNKLILMLRCYSLQINKSK